MEGLYLLAINRPRKALPLLQKVQKKNPNNLQIASNIAKILLERKQYDAAEKQFITALAIDDTNAPAHYGLGITFLRRNLLNEAIEEFLLSLESDFYFPNAHYHLGETLYKLGNFEDAAKAFEIAIRLTPGMTKAHKWLVEIYTNELKSPEKASLSSNYLANNIAGEITICTGIEHCDYESFFKLFNELTVPFISPEILKNELANLHQSSEFLKNYIGKIIFIPSHRLSFLPPGLNYKLLQLHLPENELIDSFVKNKFRKSEIDLVPAPVIELIKKEADKIETWISSVPGLKVMQLSSEELKEGKEEQIENLLEFLNIIT
jgi:hypothetical protein